MSRKLVLFMLGIVPAIFFINTAFSYNIYNTTKDSVRVVDHSVGGIDATIAPNSFVSCNPKAKGCHGKMRFTVFSVEENREVAMWNGTLDKSRGHYFIIKFYRDDEDPVGSYYGMEHFQE